MREKESKQEKCQKISGWEKGNKKVKETMARQSG